MTSESALTIVFFTVGWGIPLVALVAGFMRNPAQADGPRPDYDWSRRVQSILLCTIAFNLTFLIQEFFLVLPKAFVPGVIPTLYHNDHRWEGTAPIVELFQGTGALAILINGVFCKLLFDRLAFRSDTLKLFTLWMAFEGLFQSLPQFILGAITRSSDVGRAYNYLRLGAAGSTALALIAIAALPLAGLWIGRAFLAFADSEQAVIGWRARTRLLWQVASLPALAAIPLIVPFRVPREPIEVVVLPLIVAVIGAGWVHASAWRPGERLARPAEGRGSVVKTAAVVLLLLLFFHLVLRPGVHFK